MSYLLPKMIFSCLKQESEFCSGVIINHHSLHQIFYIARNLRHFRLQSKQRKPAWSLYFFEYFVTKCQIFMLVWAWKMFYSNSKACVGSHEILVNEQCSTFWSGFWNNFPLWLKQETYNNGLRCVLSSRLRIEKSVVQFL